jgi:hypothetical protein
MCCLLFQVSFRQTGQFAGNPPQKQYPTLRVSLNLVFRKKHPHNFPAFIPIPNEPSYP